MGRNRKSDRFELQTEKRTFCLPFSSPSIKFLWALTLHCGVGCGVLNCEPVALMHFGNLLCCSICDYLLDIMALGCARKPQWWPCAFAIPLTLIAHRSTWIGWFEILIPFSVYWFPVPAQHISVIIQGYGYLDICEFTHNSNYHSLPWIHGTRDS